jgi:hypothetical protein
MDNKEIEYVEKAVSFLKAKVAFLESHICVLESAGDNLAFALSELNPDSSFILTWEKFRGGYG